MPTLSRLPTHQKQCLTLARSTCNDRPAGRKRWLRSVAVMPNAPLMLDNLPLYSKPPHLSVSQRVPPTKWVPASSPHDTRPTARFIENNADCPALRRRRCHGNCRPAKKTPAPVPLLPSSLAIPAPTGRHSARQPHRSAAFGLWAGRGGVARCRSRGHVLTRRTGLRRYAAAGDGSFPSASRHRPPPAMCSCAARLGHCASWRHATNGARPLWMPATSVARKKQAHYFADHSTVRP